MIDVPSLLMGRAMAGEGGGGGSPDLPTIWQVGAFGLGSAPVGTSIMVDIAGYNGKHALISVMHRDTVTTPSGCTLVDETTYTNGGYTQTVSLYKAAIASDSFSVTFEQASNVRICANAWVVSDDYTLTKKSTDEFAYYQRKQNIAPESDALVFFTFNATLAQTRYDPLDMVAESNGAWICQPWAHHPLVNGAFSSGQNINQLRHFTGIVFPSQSAWVWQIALPYYDVDTNAEAQLVRYALKKA